MNDTEENQNSNLPLPHLRIAILGTRGIPARYGGFETFAEQIANRLVARGHKVTVYCRRPFTTPEDRVDPLIRRVVLPTISSKHLDTFFHSLLSVIHVGFTSADLVLICNVANSPLAWIPRLFGKPTILNVDGLDRKRRKWNAFARTFLLGCEIIALFTPTRVVTDSRVIQKYYWRRYRKRSTMIAYGADVPEGADDLPGIDVPPKRYALYVSRLEPENNPDLVLHAYRQVAADWPLLVVGGNPYDGLYVDRLKSLADPRVRFTGPVYAEGYWRLQKNAGLYICASEVGGTHPGLVEALAAGNPVVYLDTPENRETVADAGLAFRSDPYDLAAQMRRVIEDPNLRYELSQRAQKRAQALFSWDDVTERYENLFLGVLGRKGRELIPGS